MSEPWKHPTFRSGPTQTESVLCSVETLISHYVKMFVLIMNCVNQIKVKVMQDEVGNLFLFIRKPIRLLFLLYPV